MVGNRPLLARRLALLNTAFLGDAVLTLPLARAVKTCFPEAEIDFIVRRGLGPLFAAQPEFSQVLELDKQGEARGLFGLARFGRRLAARRYDLFIGAQGSVRSALLALFSRAPRRIGYAGSPARWLAYTDRVDRRFAELDEIERLLELTRPLCQGGDTLHPAPIDLADPALHWPELVLPPASRDEAAALWTSLGLNAGTPVLGVHPGSVWPTKRWLVEGYAGIIRNALERGAQVLLFAGKGEEAVANAVAEVVANTRTQTGRPATGNTVAGSYQGVPGLHSLAGQLGLPLLAACLARLTVYLGNDSGPLHLAWCQRTPVVALFGPTVRELGFYPRGPGASVHEVALDCRPCGLHGHRVCPKGHHRCMADIDPQAVWADVAAKLGVAG